MSRRSLAAKRGAVATEYVLIAIAVLVAFAFLTVGSQRECVAHSNDPSVTQNCESTLDQLGAALADRLSTTSFLLSMPF